MSAFGVLSNKHDKSWNIPTQKLRIFYVEIGFSMLNKVYGICNTLYTIKCIIIFTGKKFKI